MIDQMKFGTLLTSLWGASQLTQEDLCRQLFHVFNSNYIVDASCAARAKGCMRNIPQEIVQNVGKVEKEVVYKKISDSLIDSIRYPKGMIQFLLNVLKADNNIKGEDKIGGSNSTTKSKYLQKNVFSLEETIGDFLIYTVLKNNNQDQNLHNQIKKLKKQELTTLIKKLNEESDFTILDHENNDTPSLNPTLKSEHFEDVFSQVAIKSLNIPNPNHIQAYILNTNVYTFEYSNLEDIVLENIDNYVWSRKENQDDSIPNTLKMGHALQRLRKQGNDNQLGQILIYIFLEKVLGAPKLMSKIEMNSNYINSDGIFLNNIGLNEFQLVLGSSILDDEPTQAVDKMMNQISKWTQNNEPLGSSLLLDIDFTGRFTSSELQNLQTILKPSKNHHLRTKAFGLFIGYSLNIERETLIKFDEDNAEKYIREKICQDLSSVIQALNLKINEEKMQQYSFYVYMLPFSDIRKDSNKIMYKIRGGI